MIVGAIHESPARNEYGKRNIRTQNEIVMNRLPLGGKLSAELTDEGFVN